MRRRSRYGWLELIEGILLILLGIYTLCNPGGMLSAELPLHMVFLLSSPEFQILYFMQKQSAISASDLPVALVTGILSLLAGLNASDVPKCRRADHDPASPNLVHRSFCFQIDPHPSGPSGRKILLLLYYDCKYPWNHPGLSDDHLAVR